MAELVGHAINLKLISFFYPIKGGWDPKEGPHTHRKVTHSSGKVARTNRKKAYPNGKEARTSGKRWPSPSSWLISVKPNTWIFLILPSRLFRTRKRDQNQLVLILRPLMNWFPDIKFHLFFDPPPLLLGLEIRLSRFHYSISNQSRLNYGWYRWNRGSTDQSSPNPLISISSKPTGSRSRSSYG